MNVNFEYYKIFYYVAKYQNFTKAAHALNNSQPNITRAMNCLEDEVNCRLFIRTNRGVCLTPEGERLCIRKCIEDEYAAFFILMLFPDVHVRGIVSDEIITVRKI